MPKLADGIKPVAPTRPAERPGRCPAFFALDVVRVAII